MKHVNVCWFEIPVKDMKRAVTFYEKIFDCQLELHQIEEFDMAWFPFDHEKGGASGSLVKSNELYKPSDKGVVVYFSPVLCGYSLGEIYCVGFQYFSHSIFVVLGVSVYF
ncbi:hypothetical protein [Mongoliibacter ruber]|uniref:Glyoxalase/bleomycin resistance protein/dioxygenase superfamily protein n=1 Tax=Mongoliibacter ruber TaxID=1750599 RepID=A0A2T0WBF2_9BACT|nr:hypothetical protein [Mongoliibacter ruber]PRY84028.1 hypothetical protein CLW00_12421 [Mongoliibacter ruber]